MYFEPSELIINPDGSIFHLHLKPEDIADIILFVVTRPYHVNIADLVVMPTAQASSTIVNKNGS